MLVCSVVLRPQRHTVAATIVEIAGAFDNPSVGALFARLTDDNGSALDTLDAFSGKVMLEAANAAATVNAGSVRNVAIVEEAFGVAASPGATVIDSSGGIAATISAPATANTVQDADITSASAVAVIDGTFVKATITSTVLGTDAPDSGPITALD